ncbi:uncharacterized protein LOC125847443 [Solanum stenotomum]|uniref:uncharacterized protein LOC125847443 n=1 Tax=Solanum stenotomum TaxID=172797 RepID=UPI0020D0857B|nr:uncharacterized protein LOC125847443 [Solanum stenotomum]
MANGSAPEETSTEMELQLKLYFQSFRIGLVGKSKLGFVDGRFPKSMFEPILFDQWEKCNVVVLSWIMNVVQPGLLSSVVYASDAQKVCLDLRGRFDTVNGSRIFHLLREIHTLVQGTMSIADYHSRLRDLWDEYDVFMPCPSCPCPKSKKFGKHCDYQRLLQFLMGLNESYSSPRSQILMMSPMPTLNKAYALIIDQESQRNLVSSASNSSGVIEGASMYTHTHRSNTYSGGAGTSKNSFPSGAGGSYSGGSGGGYSSGANFKSKRKPNVYVNQATVSEECGNDLCQSGVGAGSTSGAFFTSDQYQQILHLLTKFRGNKVGESSANIVTVANADLSTGQVKGIGKEEHGLYTLHEESSHKSSSQKLVHTTSVSHVSDQSVSSDVCHRRLGHASIDVMRHESLKSLNFTDCSYCTVCPVAKQSKLPFPLSVHNTTVVFELIHCDLWGPYKVPTHNGKKSDNGCEFLSTEFQTLLSNMGILHQITCVYTPQQNGVTERKHRTILDMARALRFQASIPLRFWGECVLTAVYILNRIPTKLLGYKSSFEKLYRDPPALSHLKVFGCLCYAASPQKPDKFSARVVPAVFMGYSSTQKGYILYDIHAKMFSVNRHVVF